ncbi:MAG: 2-amino-4-hydroxy-6-hydroxymethyldihydropteridine diphosphokinase [Desulfovibrionaceae bacterium]
MYISYLSLGSNMGDSLLFLKKAKDSLSLIGTISSFSSIYKTEPQGDKAQNWFLNQVLCLHTVFTPHELLQHCLGIEALLGRKRDPNNQFCERVIDIDLLLVEGYSVSDVDLILPHPRMKERAFVLIPLAEIAPQCIIHENVSVLEQLNEIRYSLRDNTILQ